MSDFFELSEGELDAKTTSIELAGGGNIRPMPVGTRVKGVIEEAKFATNDRDGTFIEVKWTIAEPEIFAGRRVFQKIHVFAHKAPCPPNTDKEDFLKKAKKKRDGALRMFAVVDINCGDKHISKKSPPTDESLQGAWLGKMMALELDVWEIDSERVEGKMVKIDKADRPTGNWVKKVAPKSEYIAQDAEVLKKTVEDQERAYLIALNSAPQSAPRQSSGGGNSSPAPAGDLDNFDDDIPF